MFAGKNLAVFRGEDGRAHALDAYCCHNGANMAAGGLVKGSCLECPFHGWQFRGDDGKCTHIPYCQRSASTYYVVAITDITVIALSSVYQLHTMDGFALSVHRVELLDDCWFVSSPATDRATID